MSEPDELNDAERRFEHALKSVRPAPARIDATAAMREAARRSTRRQIRRWKTAAAAALVIAAGTWTLLARNVPPPHRIDRGAPSAQTIAASGSAPTPPPTLLAYRRALAQSPAELDALLDRQVGAGRSSDNQFMPAGVMTLWNANLHSPLGTM
jgi:hypothetical protein